MSEFEQKKMPYRKRHLFARSLEEVVKQATKPMMDKQGKVYGALLANWSAIVGEERSTITRPQRLQFPTGEATGATLHLGVHPAHAPALQYELGPMVEQCARYFGYRAITRIILHPAHELVKTEPTPPEPPKETAPNSMQELLHRMRQRIMSDQ